MSWGEQEYFALVVLDLDGRRPYAPVVVASATLVLLLVMIEVTQMGALGKCQGPGTSMGLWYWLMYPYWSFLASYLTTLSMHCILEPLSGLL